MKEFKLEMDYKKSTKNTYVYGEQNTDSAIPTLYIKRSKIEGDAPKSITITVVY